MPHVDYSSDEFRTPNQSEIPVFVVNGMMGVLTSDKDLVNGELIIPSI